MTNHTLRVVKDENNALKLVNIDNYLPKAAVRRFTIGSKIFEKTEQELMAYSLPITKIIEDNALKDLGERFDLYYYYDPVELTPGSLSEDDILEAIKVLHGQSR